MYHFLNVTNLTDTPYEDMHNSLDNAIQQNEDYKDCTGSHKRMHEIFDETYLDDFADLQIALDRLRDNSDPVVSSKDMRKSLGL